MKNKFLFFKIKNSLRGLDHMEYSFTLNIIPLEILAASQNSCFH